MTELTEYSQKLEGRVSELEAEVGLQAGNAARVAEEAEERIREVWGLWWMPATWPCFVCEE